MSLNLPSKPATEDGPTERFVRLHAFVPENLARAVRLAAMTRDVPVSDFVRDALADRLARDAAPSNPRSDR